MRVIITRQREIKITKKKKQNKKKCAPNDSRKKRIKYTPLAAHARFLDEHECFEWRFTTRVLNSREYITRLNDVVEKKNILHRSRCDETHGPSKPYKAEKAREISVNRDCRSPVRLLVCPSANNHGERALGRNVKTERPLIGTRVSIKSWDEKKIHEN